METSDSAAIVSDTADLDMQKALEISSEVDTTLACCSEKLANLENLLSHFLAAKNDIGANDFENDDISAELIEKSFTFDLLCAILNFELRELDNSMGGLQDLIVDALRKISSCEVSTELLAGLVRRLHDSEDLLKQSQDRILEMKIKLAKLQMTSFSSAQHEWKHGLVRQLKPEIQTIDQKGTLRMLEKSLARELELEKELKELKQNEEDLKLKVRLTEQVAVFMEEAAEVAWGRFLEADNTAEVLIGISKDTLGKLHLAHFNLSSSTKNEEEKNLTGLREKVQILEENLKITESKLVGANESNETSQKRLKETEGEIEALREKIYAAESRAESAEEKATHLTDSNIELSEELDFLKGTNDSNTKKVSVLEKQLRELDIQLQHSRASSKQAKSSRICCIRQFGTWKR
ncbi:hypothetical protein DH2020_032493 [Rehmannia glutinosa]|uniref:WIT1/2 N-terminal helical bundle domain-containing protein n=1 Tax=Rehmannia glutinosa TaxID=99300 RepID=A0ABR0VIF1_REHGL